MPNATDPQLLVFKNWTFRLREARGKSKRLLILLHGWMGDENSMWVLARKLSPKYTILGPRGPFPVAEGGYSWRKIKPGTFGTSSLEELRPSAEALLKFLDDWSLFVGVNADQFDVMGFSQGAALAYSMVLLYPERIRHLAALSGFLPEDGETLLSATRLQNKAVFIAHGRQDELISVERARRAETHLRESGAQVTYCEADAGHKVSKECLSEMERFFGRV